MLAFTGAPRRATPSHEGEKKTHARRIGEGSFLATTRWNEKASIRATAARVSGDAFQNKTAVLPLKTHFMRFIGQ